MRKLERAGWLGRLLHRVKEQNIYLPGALLREKLDPVIREVDCPVGIVVNRHFTLSGHSDFMIGGAEDLFLLDYAGNLLKDTDSSRRVRLWLYSPPGSMSSGYLQAVEEFIKLYPGRVSADRIAREDVIKLKKRSMLILSHATAFSLSGAAGTDNKLPSLLVIYPVGPGESAVKTPSVNKE